jgi:hypothetical protein
MPDSADPSDSFRPVGGNIRPADPRSRPQSRREGLPCRSLPMSRGRSSDAHGTPSKRRVARVQIRHRRADKCAAGRSLCEGPLGGGSRFSTGRSSEEFRAVASPNPDSFRRLSKARSFFCEPATIIEHCRQFPGHFRNRRSNGKSPARGHETRTDFRAA